MFREIQGILGGLTDRSGKGDHKAMLQALDRSQAVIQFGIDGTILTANENFLVTVGYSLEEIQGKHHSMFVDPTYAQSKEYKEFWEALGRGEYQAEVYKRIAKGGREVWLQASYNPIAGRHGKPVKVVKYATDITAQTLKNADYSGQVEAISKSQAVIEFELDGIILTANDNFLTTLGYSLEEVQGKHHRMFVEQDYRESPAYKAFWEALGRGEYQAAEYKRIGKGGKEVWIQASYNPIFDPSGRPFKVVKYATDITAQKKAQEDESLFNAALKENIAKILESVGLVNKESVSASAASSQTAETVQTVAAATEEFEASTQEIARSMATSKAEVSAVMEQADDADQSTQKLSAAAESMSDIVQMIQDIAGQINLLALNATIESARAGEAGKGFAVVASEVKSLANQVAKATDEIGTEITGMQHIAGEVVTRLSGIRGSMTSVEASVTSVAGAVEEQTASTTEMASSMQTVSSAVHDVSTSLSSIAQSVSQLDGDGQEMARSLEKNQAM